MDTSRNTVLAESALNAACRHIQDHLGIKDGDTAGHFFSGTDGERVADIFVRYIQLERALSPPVSHRKKDSWVQKIKVAMVKFGQLLKLRSPITSK